MKDEFAKLVEAQVVTVLQVYAKRLGTLLSS